MALAPVIMARLTGTVTTYVDWGVFAAAVLGLMTVDFLIFGRNHHMSFRDAAVRSLMCVVVGFGFAGFVYARMGTNASLQYLTAYLVEESLSVDNLFVFLVLFNYFGLTESRQQRVLFWGIMGAVVMRGLFIGAGAALLHRFHWMMYLFGAFLMYTGVKLLSERRGERTRRQPGAQAGAALHSHHQRLPRRPLLDRARRQALRDAAVPGPDRDRADRSDFRGRLGTM